MSEILRYPTGDKLLDELCEFAGARLPALFGPVPQAFNDRPSLAEDWWVADQMDRNVTFPFGRDREAGFRACYRWARNRNIETGRILLITTEQAADLLLHQMAELSPTLFGAARQIANAA